MSKFDAVIVCDTSRWSRDNQKSKEGLNILRNNGIKFFVGTMEYDLYNPEHNFILGMSAEVGELQARQQALKSITNRIERAKRGIPTGGKLPYGRAFDHQANKWRVIPEKKELIQWAANEYLNGRSIVTIAKVVGMDFTNLWKILTKRSGPEWEIRFRAPKLNINETVSITIPPLLDEETIKAIVEQGKANKTYHHGQIKNQYLLSRVIFCKHCGYALMAQTNATGKKYYRHPRNRKYKCNIKRWVPADAIGNAVLIALLETFGDVEKIEKAMQKAIPDFEKIILMQDQLTSLKSKQQEVILQRDRLVKLAAEGVLANDEVLKQIKDIRERLSALQDTIDTLEDKLENKPDINQMKQKYIPAVRVIIDALKHPSENAIAKMMNAPFERRRKLIEYAFAGKDFDGNRLGVYIEQSDDPAKPWKFQIRAVLNQVIDFYLEDGGVSNLSSY